MATSKHQQRVFDTDKRIRLGIWGLGRGMSFFNTCKFLNIDVVAGCDFNEHMRKNFMDHCPGAFVTANEDEFLKQDFDAVLLATFCPAHGPHAIKCLQAGKHVLSEVTSFFTLAEGVKLVEEVEKRGLVYNLAENYPFSAANMWLANRWHQGLFGDMMYAEYEYVHECRSLCYTYIDGVPVVPGHTVHNWRSWFNFHYYCTHSLGPVMAITRTRPVAVEAFGSRPRLAGYLRGQGADNGTMTPSLIQMDNGGVVRNLMGAGSNDSHSQRIWGTRGAFEIGHDGVRLRLGASGTSPMMVVKPVWEGLGELAAQTGHGGGDFWTLYYFAREIFSGEKGPFDIYGGCDVTIPGIQALRSQMEGGKPMDVPDFRRKEDRDRYRNDNWQQDRYNTARGVFGGFVPAPGDKAASFTSIMKDMITYAPMVRAYADWKKVTTALANPADFLPVAQIVLDNYAPLSAAFRDAREIADGRPGSDGAGALLEMLDLGDEITVLASSFLPALKRDVAALRRRFGHSRLTLRNVTCSPLLAEATPIAAVKYPARNIPFTPLASNAPYGFEDIRPRYGRKPADGLLFARGTHSAKKGGQGRLEISSDAPFKVFVNRKEVARRLKTGLPLGTHRLSCQVVWKKGKNEVVIAMRTAGGKARGFSATVVA